MISLGIGLLSIFMALTAIIVSLRQAKDTRENYEKTKEVLAQIDKKSEVIQTFVADNQRELLDTVRALAIPEKPDLSEAFALQFFSQLMQNPEKVNSAIPTLMEITERMTEQNKE